MSDDAVAEIKHGLSPCNKMYNLRGSSLKETEATVEDFYNYYGTSTDDDDYLLKERRINHYYVNAEYYGEIGYPTDPSSIDTPYYGNDPSNDVPDV